MWEYFIACAAFYASWSFITLQINYRRALSMGVPLVRVPIDPLNILIQVLEPYIFKSLDRLTVRPLPSFVRYLRRGWFWHDKAESHLRYGPIWAIVSPRSIWVQVGDPEVINNMFVRKQDFIRPSENYKLLEIYGPCISTANLQEWPRHRKVIAAPFNESIMKFVWNESTRQAKQMIASWTDTGATNSSIRSVAKDTRMVSLNVLATTGFGKSFDFQSERDGQVDGGKTSYRETLSIVLDNIILLMLLPPQLLSLPIFPKSLNKIGNAAIEFRNHMERMLEREAASVKRDEPGSGSLMTSFVRALITSDPGATFSKRSWGLSAEEVIGNMFIINFAGHDTTANTLAFALYLLAMDHKVQDWLAEELENVVLTENDWNYEHIFPQLVRCRAVLYETLRMFPPALSLPKHTPSTPQHLDVGERSVIVPANVYILPSLLAMHMHPQYWSNPSKWNPYRWITHRSEEAGEKSESLNKPARGTYFPWSEGHQNCPGRKFSEVEFVAVVGCLMKDFRLSVVRKKGESEAQAHDRAQCVVNDCDNQLLLKMRDPDRVRLRWERRG